MAATAPVNGIACACAPPPSAVNGCWLAAALTAVPPAGTMLISCTALGARASRGRDAPGAMPAAMAGMHAAVNVVTRSTALCPLPERMSLPSMASSCLARAASLAPGAPVPSSPSRSVLLVLAPPVVAAAITAAPRHASMMPNGSFGSASGELRCCCVVAPRVLAGWAWESCTAHEKHRVWVVRVNALSATTHTKHACSEGPFTSTETLGHLTGEGGGGRAGGLLG